MQDAYGRTRPPAGQPSPTTGPYSLIMGKTVEDYDKKDTLVKGKGQTWFLAGIYDKIDL